MPDRKPITPAQRALHSYEDTHFRKDASVILMPEDLTETAGDLTVLDKDGNPLGADGTPFFEIRSTESADGWSPYLGTEPQGVNGPTKQVASPYPITRESFMGSQLLIPGDLPPTSIGAARIAQPAAPILVVESAGVEGFQATTTDLPLFIAFTYSSGGKHSLLSPFTLVPPLATGQTIRAVLPTNIPRGATHVGVWITEPGTSTPSTPGPAYLQREIVVSRYNPGVYDLTGPYRHEKDEPLNNETILPIPPQPIFDIFSSFAALKGSRPGKYIARIVWTDGNGESLPSPATSERQAAANAAVYFQDISGNPAAAWGELKVLRPDPPPNATGWRIYVNTEGGPTESPEDATEGAWYVPYNSITALGNERPYPISTTEVAFGGWFSSSDSKWAADEQVFLIPRELPTQNTSGIEDPTEPLAQPSVSGAARLPAGRYYAGITESVRGRESVLSPVASKTISGSEVLRIIRQGRVNRIPNGENPEVGADGNPLDQTLVTTGGSVVPEGKTTVLKTSAAQSGATPSSATRAADVVNADAWWVEVKIDIESPASGLLAGSAEVVLEELTAGGSVAQTVLGSIASLGTLNIQKVIHSSSATGLPGGSVQWAATTKKADILVRYSGASKNMTIRIYHRILSPSPHAPRRPSDTLTTDTNSWISIPPQGEAPSEPAGGASPALVAWPAPDRPLSTGTTIESKHTFESALPDWTQVATGNGSVSRQSAAALAGSFGMRSQKTVVGP